MFTHNLRTTTPTIKIQVNSKKDIPVEKPTFSMPDGSRVIMTMNQDDIDKYLVGKAWYITFSKGSED
jgi:hypothetical protein